MDPIDAGESVAHAVEQNGHEDDGQAGLEGGADFQTAQGFQHGISQPAGADQRGDDDDAQGHHDRLVDAGQNGGHGQRDLHFEEGLPLCGAESAGCLDGFVGNAADAQVGEANGRGEGVNDGGDDAGHAGDAEEEEHGNEINEGGHGLHGVEDRP